MMSPKQPTAAIERVHDVPGRGVRRGMGPPPKPPALPEKLKILTELDKTPVVSTLQEP